jgi:hypothetical protein
MSRVVILDVGVEGGGATVFGRREAGGWRFWHNGSSICLDEDDNEDWKCWETEAVMDLKDALPRCWAAMCPTKVHPEFIPWFRDEYGRLTASEREHPGVRFYRRHWERVLNSADSTPLSIAQIKPW